jgi:FkbH-like protein
MTTPPFAQIQRLDTELLAGLPEFRISILRNIVLDPIIPYLRYFASLEGLRAVCRFGNYDNIVQEAVGGDTELLGPETDCVLVFQHLETLAPDLARGFPGLSPDQARTECDRIKNVIHTIVSGIRAQTAAIILWHGFELPLNPAFGTLDNQLPEGQGALVHDLNVALRDTLRRQRNAYVVDVNQCRARIGAGQFYDARYWHLAKAPYTLGALRAFAIEVTKFIRALQGRNKKCLVLDCDGVLWGGIVGEDGLSGIQLGTTFPGSCFRDFQQEILNLYHRGVVLALCSKNNPDDVWEVFEHHPDMVLRRHHIAAARINWQDKAANMAELARELRLGLDSFVFVEDNAFEIDLVRQFIPEVTTLHALPGQASGFSGLLASCGLFDVLAISEEDRTRGTAYQADTVRRQLQEASGDMEGFLRSLGMELEVRLADEFTIPRIAQLTQKTNQFNLTTQRYSDEDIRRLSSSDDTDVISVRYRDRFGDAGIVGVCVLRYADSAVTVDSFLLSCRILGRSVEHTFLAQCLLRAQRQGARFAVGRYRPSLKNGQVAKFYSSWGSLSVGQDADEERYQIDLAGPLPAQPEFFHVTSEGVE